MSLYFFILGMVVVPLLFVLHIIMSTGNIFRRKFHKLITFITSMKFNLNGRNVYVFPLVGVINLIYCVVLYMHLSEMHEPNDPSA